MYKYIFAVLFMLLGIKGYMNYNSYPKTFKSPCHSSSDHDEESYDMSAKWNPCGRERPVFFNEHDAPEKEPTDKEKIPWKWKSPKKDKNHKKHRKGSRIINAFGFLCKHGGNRNGSKYVDMQVEGK